MTNLVCIYYHMGSECLDKFLKWDGWVKSLKAYIVFLNIAKSLLREVVQI